MLVFFPKTRHAASRVTGPLSSPFLVPTRAKSTPVFSFISCESPCSICVGFKRFVEIGDWFIGFIDGGRSKAEVAHRSIFGFNPSETPLLETNDLSA